MRLRNVKGAREVLKVHHKVFEEPQIYKGKWKEEIFNNIHPIHIELGMGKGQFISTLAAQNPNINYIGFEKYSSVLAKALSKVEKEGLDNLKVVRMDVEHIRDVFQENEINKIYLNFSDPWPKDRHSKRRLTHRGFLAKYQYVLDEAGSIQFKTDNRELFDFSVEEFIASGWELKNVNYDLHNNQTPEDNIMTEYEEKFVSQGKPICRLEAYPPQRKS